jgi:hypothetical protein
LGQEWRFRHERRSFERAVLLVDAGDATRLEILLAENPELACQRLE